MVFTLWTSPNNKNANKALITAQYVGVKVDVPANFELGKTNKSPEFLKKNPNGKVGLAAVLFMQLITRLAKCRHVRQPYSSSVAVKT